MYELVFPIAPGFQSPIAKVYTGLKTESKDTVLVFRDRTSTSHRSKETVLVSLPVGAKRAFHL